MQKLLGKNVVEIKTRENKDKAVALQERIAIPLRLIHKLKNTLKNNRLNILKPDEISLLNDLNALEISFKQIQITIDESISRDIAQIEASVLSFEKRFAVHLKSFVTGELSYLSQWIQRQKFSFRKLCSDIKSLHAVEQLQADISYRDESLVKLQTELKDCETLPDFQSEYVILLRLANLLLNKKASFIKELQQRQISLIHLTAQNHEIVNAVIDSEKRNRLNKLHWQLTRYELDLRHGLLRSQMNDFDSLPSTLRLAGIQNKLMQQYKIFDDQQSKFKIIESGFRGRQSEIILREIVTTLQGETKHLRRRQKIIEMLRHGKQGTLPSNEQVPLLILYHQDEKTIFAKLNTFNRRPTLYTFNNNQELHRCTGIVSTLLANKVGQTLDVRFKDIEQGFLHDKPVTQKQLNQESY